MRVGARGQFDNGKRTKRIFRASPFGAEIVDRGQRVPGDALDGRFRIDEARKRFVADSPLEGDGFEPSLPRSRSGDFRFRKVERV